MRLLFICLSIPLFGQLTPSTLSFAQRQQGESPYFQSVAVDGSGNIAIGGCNNVTGNPCSAISTNASEACGAANVCVFWNGQNFDFAPGTYEATVAVTRPGGGCAASCALRVRLTVVAHTRPIFKSPSGTFRGCSSSGGPYLDLEICAPSDMRPGGTFDMPAAPGATVSDPNFGATIRRLSPAGNAAQVNYGVCGDSVTSQWNVDHSITCIQVIWDPSGATNGYIYFVNSATGAILFTNPPNRDMSWSTVHNNVYYYMPNDGHRACIHKVALNLANNTIASDSTVWCYTGPGTAASFSNGGDGGVAQNDQYWAGFTEGGSATQVCLVALQGGASYCASWTSACCLTLSGQHAPRVVQTFKAPSPSGKMWLIVGSYANGDNEFYSHHPGASALSDEGAQPLSPDAALNSVLRGTPVFKFQPTDLSDCAKTGDCRYTFHMDTVAVQGHQFLNFPAGATYPSYSEQVFLDPDVAGLAKMEVAAEAGGGMYETFPLFAAGDTHLSCAVLQPVCVVDVDGDPLHLAAYKISDVRTGDVTRIFTSPNYAGSNGDVVLIGGVAGVAGMSGPTTCTVQELNGNSFVCGGLRTKGQYRENSGSLTLNSAACSGTGCGHLFETLVYDLSNLLQRQLTVTRLMKHRDVEFPDHIGRYYGDPHSTCSADGTICAFESNGGVPDNYNVFTATTGYRPVP